VKNDICAEARDAHYRIVDLMLQAVDVIYLLAVIASSNFHHMHQGWKRCTPLISAHRKSSLAIFPTLYRRLVIYFRCAINQMRLAIYYYTLISAVN
jgi:hypothetical protein